MNPPLAAPATVAVDPPVCPPPTATTAAAADRAAGAVPPPAATAPDRRTALALLGEAVLQLHRGAREWPASRFDSRAAEVLRDLLPFDALLWGSTRAGAAPGTPLSPHGLHASGLQATTLEHGLRGALPAGALSAWHGEPLAQRRVEVHLWRWRPDAAPFDGDDAEWLAVLLPHLVEAQRQHRLARAADSVGAGATPARRSVLLCDAHAVVHQADEQAVVLLRSEWPRWTGGRLPEALAGTVAAGAHPDGLRAEPATAALDAPGGVAPSDGERPAGAGAAPPTATPLRALPVFYGRHVTVQVTPGSTDGLVLEVRKRADADRLSQRQRDVALLYAQGLTGPQIAQRLGLTPSTVNNHLGVVFKKLSVRNKVQLLQAMRAGGMSTGGG